MSNKIRIDGSTVWVFLTQGQQTCIDFSDLEKISGYSWHSTKNHNGGYYASSHREGETKYMHRVIMDVTDSKIQVDHKDGNGLNNCRSNLRLATNQQNNQNRKGAYRSKNSTGVRGVCIDRVGNVIYYKARVMWNYYSAAQKRFPFTEEGLKQADEWVREQRKILLPLSEN